MFAVAQTVRSFSIAKSQPALTMRSSHARVITERRGSRRTLTCAAEGQQTQGKPSKSRQQLAAEQLEKRKREDRPSLFTDNWGGDEWKGGRINVLSVILIVSVAVPLAGLLFAYFTFGKLWG